MISTSERLILTLMCVCIGAFIIGLSSNLLNISAWVSQVAFVISGLCGVAAVWVPTRVKRQPQEI